MSRELQNEKYDVLKLDITMFVQHIENHLFCNKKNHSGIFFLKHLHMLEYAKLP